MSALDRIKELGRHSIESRRDEAARVSYAGRERERAELEGARTRADRAARALMGDAAPPREAWMRHTSDAVTAPLGPVAPGLYPDEGEDGALIWRETAVSGALWYRPRMSNASAQVVDLAHLGRMIVERSIYA